MILPGGTLLLGFFALAFWRRMHQTYELQKFRFRMFELRDQLRLLVIDNKIDCKSWEFYVFENSISRMIHEAYYVTLFRMILVAIRNEKADKQKAFNERLAAAVGRNDEFAKIVGTFYEVSIEYVTGQHWLSYNVFGKPIVKFLIGAALIQRKMTTIIEKMIVAQGDEQVSSLVLAHHKGSVKRTSGY